MGDFQLDTRLAADTLLIGDLPLCRALLMNDRRYPWVILVPRRPGLVELLDLDSAGQAQLWQESMQVCECLRSHFNGDKLNLGALGNVVSQLHLHHVMRSEEDPAWPGPVWGHSPAEPYADDQAARVLAQLRTCLLD